MLDHDNVSLIISDIDNTIVNIYLDLCYGHRHILQHLNYKKLMDLLLMLDMYPLNNFKLKELEYYICKKYSKNNIYDKFLKDICQTYKLRYLLSFIQTNCQVSDSSFFYSIICSNSEYKI